ncbi:MAG: ATP:cob(I)alamin adenosyltransferase, partial [Bacilli bacterium]
SGNSLHAARVVARRLERRIVAYSRQAEVASAVIAYVNRLSDLLFVMARYAEEKHV